MIKLFYTQFNRKLDDSAWNLYCSRLPDHCIEKARRFIRWQNQHAHVFGRLLLQKALEEFRPGAGNLEDLKYTLSGKPYLDNDIQFNLSHSDQFVACIVADNIRVGLDIEKIRTIDFTNFNHVFTAGELENISQSGEPLKKFYDYWCIKESVAKAEGSGLSTDFRDIQVIESCIAVLYGAIWFLTKIELDDAYSTWMASSVPLEQDLSIWQIDYYKSES